jgi:hypothetical protein
MSQMFHLNVTKVDLILHMLQWDPLASAARAPPSKRRHRGGGSGGGSSVPCLGLGGVGESPSLVLDNL